MTVTAPAILKVILKNFPAELGKRAQWVGYKTRWNAETQKLDKIPVNPNTGSLASASSKEATTWGTLAQAVDALERRRGGIVGLGFVLTDGDPDTGLEPDPYVFIDFDKCRDPRTGTIDVGIWQEIQELDSYTELSPTGTGLHVIARATKPGDRCKLGPFEMYSTGRFMTVTGHHLEGTPPTIEDRPTEIRALYDRIFGARPGGSNGHAPGSANGAHDPAASFDPNHLVYGRMTDEAIVATIRRSKQGAKFGQLYDGNITGYPSASEADAALAAILAFYTKDPAQIDQIFRASKLYRADKWDAKRGAQTYGQRTIAGALGFVTESYAGAKPAEGEGPDNRPEVDAGEADLKIATAAAWDVLTKANTPPHLFRNGGGSVRIGHDTDGGLILAELNADRMRHELARAATFVLRRTNKTTGETASVPVMPPLAVVRDVLATPDHPLPVLERIVSAPVFAPDGTIQTTPGYHQNARTYYEPPAGLVVPAVSDRPSADEIKRARSLLLGEMLGDFPLATDADKAHAVAALLLPFVRALIAGPTPMHLIEAPTPGCGKGLLADVLTGVGVGPFVGVIAQPENDAEMRKSLTARLIEGSACILFDNLARLDSPTLAAAVTAPYWSDRVLGKNETVRLPVRVLWLSTGNNVTLSTELARRSVRIRLDPQEEQPWLRTGFRHADLRAWAAENRGALIWSALTLVRHWLARDKPAPPILGSFERWSYVVGGILEAAGIDGFLGNVTEFYELSDGEGATWRQLVALWWKAFQGKPVGSGDLYPLTEEVDGFDFGRGNERSQKTVFGKQLGAQRDRVYGNYRIAPAGIAHKTSRFKLEPANNLFTQSKGGDVGGRGGTFSNPSRFENREDDEYSKKAEGKTSPNVPHVPPDPPGAWPEPDLWDGDIPDDGGAS